MKKIVMVLLTVLMTVGMHAGNGTRVKVKLSAGSMFTMHRPHRAPAKELVSLPRGCRPTCQCGGRVARHSNSQRRG